MKKSRFLCLILSVVMLVAMMPSMASATETTDKPKIFVIGDSMAASYPEAKKYPKTGWGQVLGNYFTDEVEIVNCADAGESSRSFYYEFWPAVLEQMGKGDYLLFTFGANDTTADQVSKDEDGNETAALYRETSPTLPADTPIPEENGPTPNPNTTYSFKAFMKAYITETIAKGATPIMLTPPERAANRSTNVFGVQTMKEFADAIAGNGLTGDEKITGLAEELNADTATETKGKFYCLSDISEKTMELYASFGTPDAEPNYKRLFCHFPYGTYDTSYWKTDAADDTHFREFGAVEVAGVIVEELIKNVPELTKYMKTVSTPMVYDNDHNIVGTGFSIAEIKGKNTTLYPRAQFINKENADTSIQVVTARYDNSGKLCQVISNDKVNVPAQSVVSFDTSFTMPSAVGAGEIKMFVWKDYDSLLPQGNNLQKWTFTAGATSDYPVFEETFDSYSENVKLNDGTVWYTGSGDFNTKTVNGNVGMTTTGKNNTLVDLSEIILGENADGTMETVLEFDLDKTSRFQMIFRNSSNDVSALTVDGKGSKVYLGTTRNETANASKDVAFGDNAVAHFKMIINEKGKTADLYVNDMNTPLLQDVAIDENNQNKIKRFMLKYRASTSDYLWIDNISIYRQKIAE
ncbi:MAG: hypothetical protein IKB93_16565 [Clostridia bacterium]|nr:hypothetical protein [Clostridia bacterium]